MNRRQRWLPCFLTFVSAQIQVLGQQGVGPALDLLFSRPAGMPLKQTIVLWLANLNHIIVSQEG